MAVGENRREDEGARDHGAECIGLLSAGHAGGDEKHPRQVVSARDERGPPRGHTGFHTSWAPPDRSTLTTSPFPPPRSQGFEDRRGAQSAGRDGVALRGGRYRARGRIGHGRRRRRTGDDGDIAEADPTESAPAPGRPASPEARRASSPTADESYADRAERERAAAAADADRRRAALQASGVDLALPHVRAGSEPTVRNTRGGESLKPVHFGVDDATAAAIGKGARELSARRRGSKGAAAAEAGAWNSKFLARYGLDKTLR